MWDGRKQVLYAERNKNHALKKKAEAWRWKKCIICKRKCNLPMILLKICQIPWENWPKITLSLRKNQENSLQFIKTHLDFFLSAPRQLFCAFYIQFLLLQHSYSVFKNNFLIFLPTNPVFSEFIPSIFFTPLRNSSTSNFLLDGFHDFSVSY